MLISYLWLKEWIDHPLSPEELAETLTDLGLETCIAEDRRGVFGNIVIGKVLSRTDHPDADKLSLTEVDVGGKTVPIVCGAANVAEGQTVPVALPGAVLPGGLKIAERKIRGVTSHGMICSEAELGVSDESAGILVMDSAHEPGAPLGDVAEVEDVILEIDLTPNRGDCLSLLGIAREVSAATGAEIVAPSLDEPGGELSGISVEIKNPDQCPRYTAREISSVSIKPSPFKIRRRLSAIGIRPINNIVDVTNYVMAETGHPLHAFDRRDIEGNAIVVRNAAPGERFVTLDEKEHALSESDLLIADKNRGVALAGIMGGLNSEIKEDTSDVILEAAYFDPFAVRRTARRAGVSTESSFRFERGVDPDGVPFAGLRAASLMAELSGGKIGGFTDIYAKPVKSGEVTLRVKRTNDILGTELTQDDMAGFLERLGFAFKSGDGRLAIKIPPRRHDMNEEADFIEEVARMYGYRNIQPTTPRLAQHDAKDNGFYLKRKELGRLLAASGLREAINYSFVNPQWREWLNLGGVKPVVLANPINADRGELRTSLLPGLINCAVFNIRHGEENVSLFETGAVYSLGDTGKPAEEFRSAGVMTGGAEEVFSADLPRDFFRLKGILAGTIRAVAGVAPVFKKPVPTKPFLYTHRQVEITVNGRTIGFMGQLHPLAGEPFDVAGDLYCFEISVEGLVESEAEKQKVKPLPKFPGIKRDLAIIVGEREEVGGIVETILAVDEKRIRSCRIFDMYRGKQVPEGRKSLAFSLYIQDDEATLTDETGDEIMEKILASLRDRYSAEIRS